MTSSLPPAPSPNAGAVVWITGLPSSGKSRFAKNLQTLLLGRGLRTLVLDGDDVRDALVPKPGYSESERERFYVILANLAAALARQNFLVLVPATAHRRAFREHARNASPRYFEVWVDVPVEECRRRDKRGVYARFAAGLAHGVPGEDAPYEVPEHPDVVATGGKDEMALARVAARLTEAL